MTDLRTLARLTRAVAAQEAKIDTLNRGLLQLIEVVEDQRAEIDELKYKISRQTDLGEADDYTI